MELKIVEEQSAIAIQESQELAQLEPSAAAQIKATFDPMVKMLEEFEAAYNEITAKEICLETCKEAKRLRLDIGKIRIAADKEHKKLKADALLYGRAVDGVRNILKFAVSDKEEKLKDIELYFERQEEERIKKLQTERETELEQYNFDGSTLDLGKMADAVWTNFLNGTRLNYEAVKEAERKAEEERIAKEEAERAEQERIRAENEQLRKEVEAREAAAAEERRKADEALRAEREAREAAEREAREKEEARQKAEAERLRAEQEEADRLKAEEARKAAAPDVERLNEIYEYLKEQYRLATGSEAKNAIAEAGKIITAAISAMK